MYYTRHENLNFQRMMLYTMKGNPVYFYDQAHGINTSNLAISLRLCFISRKFERKNQGKGKVEGKKKWRKIKNRFKVDKLVLYDLFHLFSSII